MEFRYLFGPVTPAFAEQNLHAARSRGECLAFDPAGHTDVAVRLADTWESLCARLPGGWRPDFVVLYLPYTTLPECLWSAPVPVIGLAADWNLQWSWYRRCLPRCDLALTDVAGVEALAREGIAHGRAANLFGLERAFVEEPAGEGPRDIDVLFVGNLSPAVQRERLPWLARLAHLADRWRVVIHTGVYGAEYRALLRRARIVFNRSIRGECNRRTFEAAAAGALLFQETGNREVPAYFREGQGCVYYSDDDLEDLLDHYLENEEERRRIASAGQELSARYTFEALWQEHLALIESEWDTITARAADRARQQREDRSPAWLLARTWQALGAGDIGDPALASDLGAALVREPRSAALHNALGLAVAMAAQRGGPITGASAAQAAGYFERGASADTNDVMARLNWAEALAGSGQAQAAIDRANEALQALDQQRELAPETLDAPHFPPAFDVFRVEWERAGWANAGGPEGEGAAKRDLLRWRLHGLLAELSDRLGHHYEAVVARPDLPTTRAALARALVRSSQPKEGAEHLRVAVAANPFDLAANRELFGALGEAGDGVGQRRVANRARLLARAAPRVMAEEPWMAVPPAGDELASILVLCCNEVAYTRMCLESVLEHTRGPYELVIVDNASTDETPAYLEELRARPGPSRVVVIRNESNVGFGAGCNQALAHARGRYLVFLNNDTVVTAGWLEGLLRWALFDWPHVGLVGPVSNYAPPPQLVEPGYGDLSGLEAFAERRRRQFSDRALEVVRATGFCLLARREVLAQLGGLDERYGHGFFEDDDLCLRAREAGFKLLVAPDVYVHHFGSRTFRALGLDPEGLLRENFALFREKWGEERTAGYRAPEGRDSQGRKEAAGWHALSGAQRSEGREEGRRDTDPAPRPSLRSERATPERARVSMCMIVKNEEQNLPECLGSVEGLVDEVIVVDTGSTDATKDVARRLGAKVYDFAWVDSFAAARNESLRHATGEWVFWMDADDRIDEPNRERLRALFHGLGDENAAYVMKCRCLPDPQTGTATVVDHVRLFRNHPEIRWRHRVHEQILPAVRAAGAAVRPTDIVIQHVGYTDAALRGRKQERDLRLLLLDRKDNPDDPFTLFNLGWSYEESGRPAEALTFLERSLELSHPGDSIVRKLFALILECHRKLGQPETALAVCRKGRSYYPDDAQLLFQQGLLLRDQGDRAGAEASFVQLLSSSEGPHFASAAEGLRGHLTRHNLATLYHEQGRAAEAEAQWKTAVEERPDCLPAWLGLAEVFLGGGRWASLEEALERIVAAGERQPSARIAAILLRARGLMARREYDEAKRVLEEPLGRHPDDTALWVVLSHALLQEGKDWIAAEKALRMVLQLDPQNREAQNNLGVLLRQQGPGTNGQATAPTLADLYRSACATPSDIHSHCPILHALASECRHVTEMGTRTGISTAALLHAQPEKLVCYDLRRFPQVELLKRLAGRTQFAFHQADVRTVQIEETDLLFIDTWHVYEQLREELRLHAAKVRRYIALHDTTTFGERGEKDGHRGLWPAVEEFLGRGTFRLRERHAHNNGLAVLERA
jgi:GT2 family glycosyltransferase/Tfp pilus assembly protein PilF